MLDSDCKSDLAKTALKLWRGDAGSLVAAGDSANRVYEFTRSGKTLFLRLTSIRDRTREQIEAELDFVFYLGAGGASVALPVASAEGRFIEDVSAADDFFFACTFEEAQGERFRYADFSEKARRKHFRLRGRALGQIHALSKNYAPSARFRRFAWDEDILLDEAEKFLPDSETVVWSEYRRVKEILSALPPTNYGLIHGDFGETNYRLQEARLNVFDFDDCCYHWFAYDLAVSIYPHGWRKEAVALLDSLLEGYAENAPARFSLADITLFCQWRLIYMFLVYARKWGFKDLSPEQAAWYAQKRDNIARGYAWGL